MSAERRLGRHEILAEIGRGGMATVYLARQIDLGRLVALNGPVSAGGEWRH